MFWYCHTSPYFVCGLSPSRPRWRCVLGRCCWQESMPSWSRTPCRIYWRFISKRSGTGEARSSNASTTHWVSAPWRCLRASLQTGQCSCRSTTGAQKMTRILGTTPSLINVWKWQVHVFKKDKRVMFVIVMSIKILTVYLVCESLSH